MSKDQSIEQEIQEKGLTAPRVTPQDVDNAIEAEAFYVLGGTTLTVCVLHLYNGFTVTGESACADPANFNKELGERIARENAKDKIWPLLGFLLKEKQHQESLEQQDCPHAAPHRYCQSCVADPCPIGLGK